MKRSNFTLRLQPFLLTELRKTAEAEGVALNQFINTALAEKISALRTEKYFQQRARRADRAKTLRILKRAGSGNPARKDDQLPPGWKMKTKRRAVRRKVQEERRGRDR